MLSNRDWSEDLPLNAAGCLLEDWRKHNPDNIALDAMATSVRERCPDWAKMLAGRV